MVTSAAELAGVQPRAEDQELRVLMQRYQAADAAAVDQLVTRLSPRLMGYFLAAGAPREEAEDLLQDCWLRVHRARHTYRSGEPLMPWLFAIARHTRLDGYRRRRRVQERELLVDEWPENLQPTAETVEPDGDGLARLLQSLPASQREVIVMLKVNGMSLEEVARALGASVGAVKQKAHRAYAALRARLHIDE